MLYGVFSDIHSNIEALDAVLNFFSEHKVEGYICCGDLVGYGPDPEACLEKIQALPNLSAVCGNHDLAVLGLLDPEWFNAYARAAVMWTRGVLSGRSRSFLESLSARLEAPEFTIAHGSPRRPADEYLMTAAQFKENISRVRVWPLFVGHSHMPLYLQVASEGAALTADEEASGVVMRFLEDGEKVSVARAAYGIVPTMFNPGSVGQPRDQDKRACCALYDSATGAYRLARIEYDIPAVQAKIRAAGLPEFLALRLAYGQ